MIQVITFSWYANTEKTVSLNQRKISLIYGTRKNLFELKKAFLIKKKILWFKGIDSFILKKIFFNQQNFLEFKEIFSLTVYKRNVSLKQRNCFLGEGIGFIFYLSHLRNFKWFKNFKCLPESWETRDTDYFISFPWCAFRYLIESWTLFSAISIIPIVLANPALNTTCYSVFNLLYLYPD